LASGLTILVTIVASAVFVTEPAMACYVNYTPYPTSQTVDDPYTFVWGQLSQGGNYYYGTYGRITTTSPPDPRDSQMQQNAYMHVNAFVASQQVGTGTVNCCWSNTGWYVGYGRNGVVKTTPTAYAELVDFTGPGGSIDWVYGRYRWDAYWYYGGVWKFGGYSELTVTTTESAAAGEATNAISAPGQRNQCKKESNNGDNIMSSLSLYVGGSGWTFWSPGYGRWADIVTDPPYRRTAITDYTDQGVGGP